MRTLEQECWDRLVLLRLLREVKKTDRATVTGNLKLQKLVFLAELLSHKAGRAFAHFRFFRYNLGPYSPMLANDIITLENTGVLARGSKNLTARGEFLHEYVFGALVDDGLGDSIDYAINVVGQIVQKHGKLTGAELKSHVYRLKVPVIELGQTVVQVDKIQPFVDILDPIHDEALKGVPRLPADLVEDIREELKTSSAQLKPHGHLVRRAIKKALSDVA